jgi:hypothetical protein
VEPEQISRQAPHVRKLMEGGYQTQSAVVNLETVTISWSLLRIVGSLVTGAAFLIYITVVIYSFMSQSEIFRTTVTLQIGQLNDSMKAVVGELKALSSSPDIVRVRDLSEFCYELERANSSRDDTHPFKCPDAYQYPSRRTPIEQGWRPQ